MLAVGAKGHGLFAAHPSHEVFIGANQTIALHREQDGSQRVDHFIRAIGLLRDFGIQRDERLTHPRLDQDLTRLTRHCRGRRVSPSRDIFTARNFLPTAKTGGGVKDHLLDSVRFVECHGSFSSMGLRCAVRVGGSCFQNGNN